MLAAFEVQCRVIKALFLREMKTRFGNKRLGFGWAFIEPLIQIMIFVSIWQVMGRMGPQGVDPILFLITGIVPYIMFSNIMNKVSNAVAGNRALMVFPQIQVIDLVFARIVVELCTYSVVFIMMLLGCRYFGYEFEIDFALGVAMKFILMALLGGGIGYVLIPLSALSGLVDHVIRFVQRIMYFTSGIFFAIERLPHESYPYLIWNPVLHIMHMLRADFFPQVDLKSQFSNLYYIYFLVPLLWLLGITLTKKFMKQILEDR